GNVLSTVTDRKLPIDLSANQQVDYFNADIAGANDYYPFGMLQLGRNFSAEEYRFGFQGQERDDEIKGEGNSYTAEFWQYDSRLGRRWNVDPVDKPWESPYACFANNPIWFVDPNGADTSFSDNNTRQQFIDTYNEVNNEIKNLDNKINKKLDKWYEKGYDNERVNKRMSRRIEKLNKKRTQLNEIKSSFDEVISSDVMYFYTAKPNPNGQYISGGGTGYNTNEKRVDIWFYSGNTGTIVHETRHGSGYSWKEWGWNANTNSPTNYDYQDEFEAYGQESNYNRLINVGTGRTKLQIMNVIKQHYGSNDYIIKEFKQYCEPE
ncbi:MAG: RHS repeat-associated core domain-containing protein, partial [Bacteroidota bacterium]|nr:RHS repeat-associated core domain-containing protein [Bacteroidota bacterium]